MSKTTKAKKATTTAPKKADKTATTTMTYMQAKALTNALFHSHQTKAKLSENIDKLPESVRGKGMNADRKAEWLKEHGNEEASYGQCKMFAYGLLNTKYPYDKASKMIADLDAKNGYVRQPKAEQVVKAANEKAQEAKSEQPTFNLVEEITEAIKA